MGTPAMGTPAMGTPAMGTPAMGTPAMGTPAMGTPAMGTSAMGTSTGSVNLSMKEPQLHGIVAAVDMCCRYVLPICVCHPRVRVCAALHVGQLSLLVTQTELLLITCQVEQGADLLLCNAAHILSVSAEVISCSAHGPHHQPHLL